MPACFKSLDYEIVKPSSVLLRLVRPRPVPELNLTMSITQHSPKRVQQSTMRVVADQLHDYIQFDFLNPINKRVLDFRLEAKADGLCHQVVSYNFFLWRAIAIWISIALAVVFFFTLLIAIINLVIWMKKEDMRKRPGYQVQPDMLLKPLRIEHHTLPEETSVFNDVLTAA